MLLVPCLLGCFTRCPHFECSVFRSLLHCSVRLLAHPIVSKLKPTKSTAQYCYACLAAGQHQFRAPELVSNSFVGSRLGLLSLHLKFGGALWARITTQHLPWLTPIVPTTSTSPPKIGRDRSLRLASNPKPLAISFWILPAQSITCFQKASRLN